MRSRLHLILRLAALAVALALPARALHAQDSLAWGNLAPTADTMRVQLRLRDGTVLVGRIVSVTPTTVRVASVVGENDIPRSAIVEVRYISVSQVQGGEVWQPDPSTTRLFFAPTGRALKAGEGYFADAYIFFPSFQYGLSDAFTIGAGMSVFPGAGIDDQLFYLTPKLNVYASPTVNVSVGALVAGAKDLSDASPFGLLYGVSTFGDVNTSLSIGTGFGYAGGTADRSPLLMIGGSNRVSQGLSLVTENYWITGAGVGLVSGGVRFMGDKLSVDLAGFTPLGGGMNSVVVVPYVSFVYRY